MRRQLVDQIAPPLYGAIDFAVILAPAVAMKVVADRGGMGDTEGIDLLIASGILGLVHGVVAWARLRDEERIAVRRADLWIAAVDALVVLTLAATVLPVAVLWGFADEHASIANRGYPVVALWVGVQGTAVLLAEVTGRVVFWWLEPHPTHEFAFRRHLFRQPRTTPAPDGVHRSDVAAPQPRQGRLSPSPSRGRRRARAGPPDRQR
jgi:hypothetical protein